MVKLIYDLLEYSKKYSKTSARLWEYYSNKPSDPIRNSEPLYRTK